ncbi:hypothetical protein [Psychroserpens damuponensis]|uniref:hypothetical protein n=1 Tax=Psychroserpens damuponensis TaxID=943936 RepID=UPI00058FBA9E|nr:hypothetical protein [Psychroserpens damuponensis]
MLLITVFTFTNCQEEEFIIESAQSTNELLFHQTRYVFEDEIDQNRLLSEILCDLKTKPLKSKKGAESRLIYNSDYDFTIETDFAKYMESFDGTFHSYTFQIIQNDVETTTLDNLVLFSIDGAAYNAKLIKYTLSEDQLNQLINEDHIDSNLEVEVIDLEGDFNSYLQRAEGDCEFDISVQHVTPAGNTFIFIEGVSTCHHVGECDVNIVITLDCPETSSGSSGPGSTTGNSNPIGPTGNSNTGGSSAGGNVYTSPSSTVMHVRAIKLMLDIDVNDSDFLDWLEAPENIFTVIRNYLVLIENKDENGDIPQHIIDNTSLGLRAEYVNDETDPKWNFDNSGTFNNISSLQFIATYNIPNNGGTMYLLDNGGNPNSYQALLVSQSPYNINGQYNNTIGPTDIPLDGVYSYIYDYNSKQFYEFGLPLPDFDCLSCDLNDFFEYVLTNTLIITGRYFLPLEDIVILIDGKDFEGVEQSRALAAAFL